MLEKKSLALIGMGRQEETLSMLREMLAQRAPGDEIERFLYELLRIAPDPPDELEEMIALLEQGDEYEIESGGSACQSG